MGNVVRRYAIVVEQEPLTLILHNAVMGCPTNNGIENHALIGERAVGVVTNGIAEEVAVTRRVTEIVLTIVLMHPRGLEETMGVACLQGLTILVDNNHIMGCLCKLHHITIQAHHETG